MVMAVHMIPVRSMFMETHAQGVDVVHGARGGDPARRTRAIPYKNRGCIAEGDWVTVDAQ